MSGTIYSSHYRIGTNGTYSGITLSNPATQNPATLSNYIYTNSGPAVLGSAGTAWTFSNQGLLIDYGMGSKAGDYGSLNNPGGIDLLSGGLVVNGNTGPGGQGRITGGGPFYADGRIEETTAGIAITGGAGTILNYGTVMSAGVAVTLGAGGTIINGSASDTIASLAAAVVVAGAPGIIGNFATIGHGGELGGNGIVLEAGGVLANAASGYLRNGTTITGGAGTIFNSGLMNHGISLGDGGLVDNQGGGQISYGVNFSGAAATLVNAGNLSGSVTFSAAGSVANTGTVTGSVILAAGTVTNGQSGSTAGTIHGVMLGVSITGTAALVTNYGDIAATLGGSPGGSGAAVQIAASGVVLNHGTLSESGGYKGGAGVILGAGATLLNTAVVEGSNLGAYGTGATIDNTGLIGATGLGSGGLVAAVGLNGGLLVNSGTAQVVGGNVAGAVFVGGGTIVNTGAITSTGNASSGATGVYVEGAGTLLNTGTILSTVTQAQNGNLSLGIKVAATAAVSIANFGTILAGDGVFVLSSGTAGVTLLNAGLIEGTGTANAIIPTAVGAVRFAGGNNLLAVEPGATFDGLVAGGTGTNTLEFAAGTAARYGILNGIGSSVINFGTLEVDPGADWELSGTLASGVTLTNDGTLLANAGTLVDSTPLAAAAGATGTAEVAGHGVLELLSSVAASQTARFIDLVGTLDIGSLSGFAGTIAGFAGGDTLTLLGVTATTATYGNHQLTISNGSTLLGHVAVATNFTGDTFTVHQNGANADITTNAPCFAAGTRLRTPHGEIAVEHLHPGMQVATLKGSAATVVWVGHRRVDCRRHPRPDLVQPVRVAAGAFAPNTPTRALLLSPDHAVFTDGVLIPVKHLVNGRSIVQIAPDAVTYFHVELASHDILLAENLPTESYLDTGNRSAFANAGSATALHPLFAPLGWEHACAELVQDGPRVISVRRTLFARAGLAEARPALSLQTQAGRRELVPECSGGGHWRYDVPPRASFIHLSSPAWVPAHCFSGSLDRRPLGIRLFGAALDDRLLDFEDPLWLEGFYRTERTAEGTCRWTNGDARLALRPGTRVVTLQVGDQPTPGQQRQKRKAVLF